MNKQALSLAVCIAGAYPLSSGAIGLGDIRSSSHLNQPLNAKIELLSTSAQEAKQVQVRLASADVFNRVGIDRPAYLNSLRFTSTIQNGKPVILVSSSQPIKEPFLNFLLEVSWPKGQLLKEYTVLLDPPVLLQAGRTSGANTAAVRAEPKATGFVKRPTPAQTRPTQRAQNQQQQVKVRDGIKLNFKPKQQATPASSHSSRKSKYRVHSGDTLYKIATRLKPRSVSADQMMVALFRANPEAFRRGNINRLKAGATLKIPSSASGVSTRQAKRIIRKHYTEWKQYRKKLAKKTVSQKSIRSSSHKTRAKQSPTRASRTTQNTKAHLEVMGGKRDNTSKASSKVSAAGKARISELDKQLSLAREALISKQRENADLKSRVAEMESIIQKKNRLIALKNDQLAKLQRSLANNGKATGNNNRLKPTTPAPVNTDLSAHIANTANQDAGKINRTQPAATQDPQAKTTTTPPQARQNDLTPAALAAKRRAAAMAEANDKDRKTPEETGFKPEKENALLDLLSSPIVTAAGAGSILLLLLGWLLLSRRKNKQNDDGTTSSSAALSDFDDEFTALNDDNININADDTSNTDDDFFKDFEDDLNLSSEKKSSSQDTSNAFDTNTIPETDNVSTALDDGDEDDDILQEADVYIVYGLHEQAEAELKKAIAAHPEKLEYRHKLLENYLASNNKEAFDLQAQEIHNLDGANKATIWEKVVEMGRKISPDNALYQTIDDEPASSSTTSTATKIAAGATAAAAVAAAAMNNGNEQEDTEETPLEDDFNLDELLLDDDNIDEEINAAIDADQAETEQQEPSVEMPTESETSEDVLNDFSDLEDDFSDFGLDDDEFSLDDLEKELDDKATTLDSTDADESNIIDFESMLLDENGSTKKTDDDLELANLNLEVDSDTGIDRILPQGTAYTAQGNAELYGEDDDVLSFLDLPEEDIDLQEAHISTKLDLARAYLDMGDIEGARSTLEEVIVEGSDDQKREAEDLLHQTG